MLLPRAAEGRDELARELRRAGLRVDVVAAYRTVPADERELAPLLAQLEAGSLDVLTFFAPSQVEAVARCLGDRAPAVLGQARVIAAIGPTTAAALATRGVRCDLIAPTPGARELAAALATSLGEHPAQNMSRLSTEEADVEE